MAVGNRKTHVVRATTEPLYHGELDAIEKMRVTVAEVTAGIREHANVVFPARPTRRRTAR